MWHRDVLHWQKFCEARWDEYSNEVSSVVFANLHHAEGEKRIAKAVCNELFDVRATGNM
jgi:hypothetical protein